MISVYGNGFGVVPGPYHSGSPSQSGQLVPFPKVTIAGEQATVQFAGLISAGLFQLNIIVPADTQDGDVAIAANSGPLFLTSTQAGTLVTVQR